MRVCEWAEGVVAWVAVVPTLSSVAFSLGVRVTTLSSGALSFEDLRVSWGCVGAPFWACCGKDECFWMGTCGAHCLCDVQWRVDCEQIALVCGSGLFGIH